MLIEDLIRLGRALLDSGELKPHEILKLISGVEDDRVKNFYRNVVVVDIPADDSQSPSVLTHQQFGEIEQSDGKEDFKVDDEKAVGIPFVLPSGGNPIHPQGRYLAAYPIYDAHFRGDDKTEGFVDSAAAVKKFLSGRLERTIGLALSESMLDRVASAVHRSLAESKLVELKNFLGVLVLARCGPDSFYHKERSHSNLNIGICDDDSEIVPDFPKILEGYWNTKIEEGKEIGVKIGTCSFTGAAGEVYAPYCKAWLWALPTWTCPLPLGGKKKMMIESVALSADSYKALTLGASIFNRLTERVSRLVIHEIFSPVDDRIAKNEAQRRKIADLDPIYGSGFLLPLKGDSVPHDDLIEFVKGVKSMLKKSTNDPTMADRHMALVTGFDLVLPEDLTDEYRLTLVYFSGDIAKGEIHLRAYIQDVVPSVMRTLRDIGKDESNNAIELLLDLSPKTSEKQKAYLKKCYESIPYLLARAYGGSYLWSLLEAALHRRALVPDRAVYNSARRMQSLAHSWPDSRFELVEEVCFHLSFQRVLNRINQEIAHTKEDSPVRPWKDMLDSIENGPVESINELNDPAEIGFACGALFKRFSRNYYRAMQNAKANPDFLADRVLTFGTDLRIDAIPKGLSSIVELPKRIKNLKIPGDLVERTGAVINAFERAKDSIRKDKDSFLVSFWSGYALQGFDRKSKRRLCPHCGKPIHAEQNQPVQA
jgi:hypothetical protein